MDEFLEDAGQRPETSRHHSMGLKQDAPNLDHRTSLQVVLLRGS